MVSNASSYKSGVTVTDQMLGSRPVDRITRLGLLLSGHPQTDGPALEMDSRNSVAIDIIGIIRLCYGVMCAVIVHTSFS